MSNENYKLAILIVLVVPVLTRRSLLLFFRVEVVFTSGRKRLENGTERWGTGTLDDPQLLRGFSSGSSVLLFRTVSRSKLRVRRRPGKHLGKLPAVIYRDDATGPKQTTRRPGVMSAPGREQRASSPNEPARVRSRLHYGKLYSERRFDLLFKAILARHPMASRGRWTKHDNETTNRETNEKVAGKRFQRDSSRNWTFKVNRERNFLRRADRIAHDAIEPRNLIFERSNVAI